MNMSIDQMTKDHYKFLADCMKRPTDIQSKFVYEQDSLWLQVAHDLEEIDLVVGVQCLMHGYREFIITDEGKAIHSFKTL